MSLLDKCTCGESKHSRSIINGIEIMTCDACGLQRQFLEMTEEEYFNFYADDYATDYQVQKGIDTYVERYEQDKKVSELRVDKYNKGYIKKGSVIIDVGSSNGAFVDYMRTRGYNSTYGVEIAKEASDLEFTYNQALDKVNFPTNYAGTITLHDVIEHVPTPETYLKECHRILEIDGILIVDLPHYHIQAGTHHWKKIEHLWYWTEDQMVAEVEKYGFELIETDLPIPGKIVFYFKKLENRKNPLKIITMPGMGDNYWILVKLQSWIEKNGYEMPDLYVWDQGASSHIHNKHRSEDFLNRLPFINYCGPDRAGQMMGRFREFYTIQAPSKTPHNATLSPILTGVNHFDFAMNFNGILEDGKSLDSWGLEQYDTNWHIPMFTPWEEKQKEKEFMATYGEYNVCYFNDHGFYKKHMCPYLTPDVIADMLNKIHAETGRKTVLIGTTWDQPYQHKIHALAPQSTIDMTLKTSVSDMFALFRGSKMIIGWASGSTIMGAVFGVPTIMYWSREQWINISFMDYALDPVLRDVTYFPHDMEEVKDDIATHVQSIVDKAKTL